MPLSRALVAAFMLACCYSFTTFSTSCATAQTVINNDGAWCWFQDERAVVLNNQLLVGSVSSGRTDPTRHGDINVTVVDLKTMQATQVELYDQLECDDHDAPALWVRPDGRVVAVFAKHGSENRFYYRISNRSPDDWSPVRSFIPSYSSRITYANLLFLADENNGQGRLYNFYRGLDNSFKPSYSWSDDWGKTWFSGWIVIDVPTTFRHRPYVKYATDGRDTIHLLYTDGHPRNFDNSVYHVYYREGTLHRSDGSPIRELAQGLASPDEGTRVYRGDEDHVAWVSDAHVAKDGRPYVVFSVQVGSAGLPSGHPKAGQDHRYHYAFWDGRGWREREIAFAGSRLYPGEDDYTGNICLDPGHLNRVFISADVDPRSGKPLISQADGKRHYEIFQGETQDQGSSWSWKPITQNSTNDNLRPIVPITPDGQTYLLWFRGQYDSYRKFATEVVLQKIP